MAADPVQVLCDLGGRLEVGRLIYRKPAEKNPEPRLVEPYALVQGAEMPLVLCWQQGVAPDHTEHGYRTFRPDRIESVQATGQAFKPRREVTIHTGEIGKTYRPPQSRHLDFVISASSITAEVKGGPTPEQYYRYLRECMLDGRITDGELRQAKWMNQTIPADKARAVHGSVFSTLLTEALVDGLLTETEVAYIRLASQFLHALGWAPGD